jgi:mannosyltransferase
MNRRFALLLLILLLAFGLRLEGLGDRSIWLDEGYSSWLARQSVGTIVDWTAHDVHPPLYYLLLHAWWQRVGEGEFVLRFPGVLIGLIGVALVYGLGREVGGRRAGLLGALFFALARFTIQWSQEMRMHMLAGVLVTAALWAAVRWWRCARWRTWIGYVLGMTGALYTFYLAGLGLMIANLAFPVAWLRRGRPRRMLVAWIAAQALAVALFIPWLNYALPRMYRASTEEPFKAWFGVQYYLVTLAVGVDIDPQRYFGLALVALAVLGLGAAAIWHRRSGDDAAALVLLALGVALPAPVVFALALPIHPDLARPLTPRYFLPLAACFYVLMGWGLVALARKHRWAAAAGACAAAAISLVGLSSFYPNRWLGDDYISLAHTLEAHRQPGDNLLLFTDRQWPIFAAHYAGSWSPVPYRMPLDAPTADWLLGPLWNDAPGLWVMTTPDAQRADPGRVISAWLDQHAAASASWDFGDNRLTLYTRTPERTSALYDLAPGFTPPDGPQYTFPSGARLSGAWLPVRHYGTGDTIHLSLYWEQPPGEPLTVEVRGPDSQTSAFDPPPRARSGPTDQLANVALSPALRSGRYELVLHVGASAARLGTFDLTARRLNAVVADTTGIEHPLHLRFGDRIELIGYDLDGNHAKPGNSLAVTLYWRATAPIPARYKVSVYVLGKEFNPANGTPLWGQQDNEPDNWQAPTTLWTPGTVIADAYRVPIAPHTPDGTYELGVLMYGLVDGARLPIYDAGGTLLGDMVTLEPITVAK